MLVETSAIVSILLEEFDAVDFVESIDAAEKPVTTVVNAFEAALSVGRTLENYRLASRLVPELLEKVGVGIVGIEPDMYEHVVDAYLRYGKGTGHAAKLNFGDCFSYAFAKRANVPLLFKGDDFSHTDLARVEDGPRP